MVSDSWLKLEDCGDLIHKIQENENLLVLKKSKM